MLPNCDYSAAGIPGGAQNCVGPVQPEEPLPLLDFALFSAASPERINVPINAQEKGINDMTPESNTSTRRALLKGATAAAATAALAVPALVGSPDPIDS
jgi:hypothetical protein